MSRLFSPSDSHSWFGSAEGSLGSPKYAGLQGILDILEEEEKSSKFSFFSWKMKKNDILYTCERQDHHNIIHNSHARTSCTLINVK